MTERAPTLWPFWPFRMHRHEFVEFVGMRCAGVTLNRALRPEPCYDLTYRCSCGKEELRRFMLLPLATFKRDEDGWPLDDRGNRMEIAR